MIFSDSFCENSCVLCLLHFFENILVISLRYWRDLVSFWKFKWMISRKSSPCFSFLHKVSKLSQPPIAIFIRLTPYFVYLSYKIDELYLISRKELMEFTSYFKETNDIKCIFHSFSSSPFEYLIIRQHLIFLLFLAVYSGKMK